MNNLLEEIKENQADFKEKNEKEKKINISNNKINETIDYERLTKLEKDMIIYFIDQKAKIQEMMESLNKIKEKNQNHLADDEDQIIPLEKNNYKKSESIKKTKIEKSPFSYYCYNDHLLTFISRKELYNCSKCLEPKNNKCKFACPDCFQYFCIRCCPPKLIEGLCPLSHPFKEKFRFITKCDVCKKKTALKYFIDEICNLEICKECRVTLHVHK